MSTANRGVNIGPPRFKIAVHSIVWLAKSGSVLSSAMIANQVDSHATFMRRVMHALATAGIVESRGGREGGYILRRPADQITLGEIYSAVSTGFVEPDVNCGEAGEQLDVELEKILHEAEQRTIEYLRQYTIADVMNRVEFFVM
ncbi:Rrf2 family transcriptional regulator [Paenibacillus validus]|uniref:RrF2 family transcriptional regulator n=1 Tax=Paenibacillus TaxID=44249 RepID=UPI000FD6EC71|nr:MULTISPECIES: Rrf2 family transcriptional regulator [Paenibacillus]MED4600237.1 Rrf2 family transcriptional regulator [Paenibacillus validus]MED4605238.1 Rrf2 family transcriptional regulator [Paenibacillus validus]